MLRRLALGVMVLTLALAVACGGGDDGAAPTATSTAGSGAAPAATATPTRTRPPVGVPTNTPTAFIPIGTPLPEAAKIFEGAQVFVSVHCEACHKIEGLPGDVRDQIRSGFGVSGPQLDGVATAAETRVPGLSAEEYLRQSMLEPQAYVVEGFDVDMPLTRPQMTTQQYESLIVFLLTLK